MLGNYRYVYQFKIALEEVEPPIWRRIQVPDCYSFWDFHVAIQDAMGWKDTHLHQFEVKNRKIDKEVEYIGIPDTEELSSYKTLPGWRLQLFDYFSEENQKIRYLYDFGDNWEHSIVFEKILFKQSKQKYPVCIEGERSCPPEDCGGAYGYDRLIKILQDPEHEEHKDMKKWVGKKFDSEQFEAQKIKFTKPWQRLENILYS